MLFAVAPMACVGLLLGFCFVLQYFVSFLVLQSSPRERELLFLLFCCVRMLCHCFRSFTLPRFAVVRSVLCNCGISWPNALTFWNI